MKTHELKCWPEYYELCLSGAKPFEIRLNDRDYQQGDSIFMREWDPDTSQYTGRSAFFSVGYILRDYPAIKDNHVVMTIRGPFYTRAVQP